jgi:hypothetical protein
MEERQFPRRFVSMVAVSVPLVIGVFVIPVSSRHISLELSGLVLVCGMAAAALW